MSERIIERVTQEELRRITTRDRRTIKDRLVDLPFVMEGRKKLYDKRLALEAIMAGSGGSGDSEAKARKALADAEKIELIVAKMRGELVPVEQMKSAAAELIKTLYMRTVRVSPSILAPKLVNRTDVLDIEAIIREELAGVFNELKSMPDNFIATTTAIEAEESE